MPAAYELIKTIHTGWNNLWMTEIGISKRLSWSFSMNWTTELTEGFKQACDIYQISYLRGNLIVMSVQMSSNIRIFLIMKEDYHIIYYFESLIQAHPELEAKGFLGVKWLRWPTGRARVRPLLVDLRLVPHNRLLSLLKPCNMCTRGTRVQLLVQVYCILFLHTYDAY